MSIYCNRNSRQKKRSNDMWNQPTVIVQLDNARLTVMQIIEGVLVFDKDSYKDHEKRRHSLLLKNRALLKNAKKSFRKAAFSARNLWI